MSDLSSCFEPGSLLDPPPFPTSRVADLADRLASLFGVSGDLLLIQAEAVVALEAVATSIGRPAIKAINIVTSPYGAWFGGWMRKAGATVIDICATPARPIDLQAVADALAAHSDASLLAIVHAQIGQRHFEPA